MEKFNSFDFFKKFHLFPYFSMNDTQIHTHTYTHTHTHTYKQQKKYANLIRNL